MSNTLNRDINGCVILVAARHLTDNRQEEKHRKFRVDGGFGACVGTAGNGVFGVWLDDSTETPRRIEGWMVEAVVEEPPLPSPSWRESITDVAAAITAAAPPVQYAEDAGGTPQQPRGPACAPL